MTQQKLYLVVLSSLSPAQKAVQACHAALKLASDMTERRAGMCPAAELAGAPVALLSVETEGELYELALEAGCYGITEVIFREPDMGHRMTAAAFWGNGAEKLLRKLPLVES